MREKRRVEVEPSAEELSAEELLEMEQEELSRPPLPGKEHPPADKDDATPTLDDEVRNYHHHPNEAGTTTFGFDPEAADAAADLAGDLGTQFLEGATRGEDMSDRVLAAEDAAEAEVPFLIEEIMEGGVEIEEEAPSSDVIAKEEIPLRSPAPPRARKVRR